MGSKSGYTPFEEQLQETKSSCFPFDGLHVCCNCVPERCQGYWPKAYRYIQTCGHLTLFIGTVVGMIALVACIITLFADVTGGEGRGVVDISKDVFALLATVPLVTYFTQTIR